MSPRSTRQSRSGTYKTLTAGIVIALSLGALASTSTWAHRFFVSLAELDYDAERSAIEVSLRVDDHNLEDALREQRGRKFHLTMDDEGERAARAYVAERFQIAPREGDPLPIQWVGWEWTTGATWLYFEIPLPEGSQSKQLTLANTLFLELSEQQVNTVTVRTAEGRDTLSFGHKVKRQTLPFPQP